MCELTNILLGGFILENLLTEEKKRDQFDNSSSMPVWERVGQLADITDSEEYIKKCNEDISLIIKEVKQINSETRFLFGKPGDAHPWILSDNKKVKIYRIIQKLGNLQSGENPIRIKKQTDAKAVNMYMGILKLKMCMDMLQVFAYSYRKILPNDDSKTRMDLTFIINTAIEINDDLEKALESNKLKRNSYAEVN